MLPPPPERSLGSSATKVAISTTRKGDYSDAYIKRHPGAPPSVQWQAGVVVKKGSDVDTNVWSSRANW